MIHVISLNQNRLLEKIISDIKVDNSLVKKVNSYNHLGITTDSNLNWIEHLEGLKTKLLKSIAFLYKKDIIQIKLFALYLQFNYNEPCKV